MIFSILAGVEVGRGAEADEGAQLANPTPLPYSTSTGCPRVIFVLQSPYEYQVLCGYRHLRGIAGVSGLLLLD